MNKPLIFNIQRFSTHDGDGVRTTLFFKGCPVKCKWCHNPESQHFYPELITYKSKCTSCGRCIPKCPKGAISFTDGEVVTDRTICENCGKCTDACLNEARELAGKEYTVQEAFKEAMKDRMFFERSGGGVTLSGGEVMVQDMDFVEALCRKLYREGISVFIDTCGYAPFENFERILPYVDTFLYDIKLLDPEEHKKYIGVDNALILENLKKLSEKGARIYIRIPTIGGVNATQGFMEDVIKFLKENGIQPAEVSILPYHDMGKSKYGNLSRDYDSESMSVPSNDFCEHFKLLFEKAGYQVKIGG